MITSWTIYWITRLDCMVEIICGLAFSSIGIGLLWLLFSAISFDSNRRFGGSEKYKMPKHFYTFGLIGLFLLFIGTLLPTTKQMYAILILPKMANSEITQEVGEDVLDMKRLAMEYLKDKLEIKKEESK